MVTPRLPDLEPGQGVVVEPGSPQDPFTQQNASVPPAQPASPEGAPAGQPGAPTGDAINPSELPPARPVLAPPPPVGSPAAATPAQSPAESAPQVAPVQAAPAQPAQAPVPTIASPAVAAAAPQAPVPLTEEQIRAEERTKVVGELRAQQGGQDKRMAAVEAESARLQEQLTSQRTATREVILGQTAEADKPRLRETWELEDARSEVNSLRDSTISYGQEVELAHLVLEYSDVPTVNEEALKAVAPDERERWALEQQNAHLRTLINNPPPAQAAVPAAAAVPAVPAGVHAQSDVGGAGTPPPPASDQLRTDQSPEAFVENIGKGWQRVDFAQPR